ncbi:MAG: histidine kinase [Lachnospiraceae bacterium]|nr:histidine kinase [Lachnospiraceae bacterium]
MKNHFDRLKFRTKLTILLIVVGFVPIAVLGVSMFMYAHNTVVENREDDMTNSLEQACAAVASQVAICEQMIDYFVYDQNVIDFLECSPEDKTKRYEYYQEVCNIITALEYQNLNMQTITIYSENITSSFGKETEPLSKLQESKWYDRLDKKGGTTWFYDSASLDFLAIHKIPSYSGIESYMVVSADTFSLLQSLQQMAVESYGVHVEGIAVGDALQGTMSKDSQYAVEEIGNFNGTECVDENGRFLSFDKDNSRYLWIEQEIEPLSVKAFYYTPTDRIKTISWDMALGIAVQIMVCVILILLLGGICSDYIASPIELLTKDIQMLDAENMQTTITSERRDEIGTLIQSYNHMVLRIQELIQENYRTKIAQKEFEMKALQAQINPHFLYNSLSIINWKAVEAGEKEISRITLALSSFYRTTLNRGQMMNTIQNAVENIKSYLAIQLCMHDDNFTVHYEIDEGTYNYYIPLLIFQPFVENALEHGLDLKEDPDHQLWISISQDEKDIHIEIKDNGVGMEQAEADKSLEYDAKGYGVKNVNDRMILHYGEEYHVVIRSAPGQGTSAMLRIPKAVKDGQNAHEK